MCETGLTVTNIVTILFDAVSSLGTGGAYAVTLYIFSIVGDQGYWIVNDEAAGKSGITIELIVELSSSRSSSTLVSLLSPMLKTVAYNIVESPGRRLLGASRETSSSC